MHHHHNHQEEICWPEGLGIKKTKQREEVFHILINATEPLSAQEIYQRLLTSSDEHTNYAVSTIYRILSAFEEKELVIKSSVPNGETALYEWNRGHKHYAICLSCHKHIPLSRCPFEHANLEKIPLEDTGDGFTITGHRVELYGYCKDCGQNH